MSVPLPGNSQILRLTLITAGHGMQAIFESKSHFPYWQGRLRRPAAVSIFSEMVTDGVEAVPPGFTAGAGDKR
jgi:hypothetical protein